MISTVPPSWIVTSGPSELESGGLGALQLGPLETRRSPLPNTSTPISRSVPCTSTAASTFARMAAPLRLSRLPRLLAVRVRFRPDGTCNRSMASNGVVPPPTSCTTTASSLSKAACRLPPGCSNTWPGAMGGGGSGGGAGGSSGVMNGGGVSGESWLPPPHAQQSSLGFHPRSSTAKSHHARFSQ